MRRNWYFPFQTWVLNKGTTGTIFITSLTGDWTPNLPPPKPVLYQYDIEEAVWHFIETDRHTLRRTTDQASHICVMCQIKNVVCCQSQLMAHEHIYCQHIRFTPPCISVSVKEQVMLKRQRYCICWIKSSCLTCLQRPPVYTFFFNEG